MSWLKLPIGFIQNQKVFLIKKRELDEERGILDALRMYDRSDSTALISDALRKLIVSVRPDLANIQIDWMDYDACSREWKVCVSHPSFEETPEGECIKSEYLYERTENIVA